MNILFVGGPMDGKREPLPPRCGGSMRCIELERPLSDIAATSLHVKEHAYFLQAVGSHRVMLYEKETGLIEALIKGYHRHRKPSRWPRRPRGPSVAIPNTLTA
jgi:hypothetical protein